MPNTPLPVLAAEAGAMCSNCGHMATANNHVRVYSLTRFDTITLCSRCRNREYNACHSCASIARPWYLSDEGYCTACAVACAECGGRYPGLDSGVCADCGWTCYECATVFPVSREINWSGDDRYCDECVPSEDEDEDGDFTEYGVRGYGHTHPNKWFGGPLPRDKANKRIGYYLGFELEIYAEVISARQIRLWEKANGLEGFFDCKQDGSVEGFEIATQPFTPQFFERLIADGRWASFFTMLNQAYPLRGDRTTEPEGHGLHVHVGKVAFGGDDVSLAAFSYLLGQDSGVHLERIARRDPTGYCERVPKPVSQAIVATKASRQKHRLYAMGVYPGRGAINLSNPNTVEIRAFRSTRDASELAAAVRLVYVAAEYARYLRSASKTRGVDPKRLGWMEFCRWAAFSHPDAFGSLVGMESGKVRKTVRPEPVSPEPAWSVDDFVPELWPEPVTYLVHPQPVCGVHGCDSCRCMPTCECYSEAWSRPHVPVRRTGVTGVTLTLPEILNFEAAEPVRSFSQDVDVLLADQSDEHPF